MTPLRLCSAAEEEFTEALCWYANRSREVALDFDTELELGLARIADDPESFPYCDDRHRFVLMRRFPYQIIYRVINEEVTVIAIAHTSRQPAYWRER